MEMKINSKLRGIIHSVLSFLGTFAIAFVVFFAIFSFIRFPKVSGSSMEPTYHDGQMVVALRTHNVERNDVAILWSNELDEYIIKRVIGVSGDTIRIDETGLYRNNKPVYESYVNSQGWSAVSQPVDLIVGHNEVFVMGDNREKSNDSRNLGVFDLDDVFGIVVTD